MNPLLEQFLEEARENLKFIEQNLEELGSADGELLNSIFRAAHTLKGGSGIVGFESVKNITHKAEDLLDMLRSGDIGFKEEMLESLYDAFDEVLNLIEAAEETGDVVDADEDTLARIIDSLNEMMGKSDEATEWEVPFNVIPSFELIVNQSFAWIPEKRPMLPFTVGKVDETFIADDNYYAIYFDLDEDCMVFGNDPLYALSLLGDKVIHVGMRISEENTDSILSVTDGDDDAVLLRSEMYAIVKAPFDEIDEALYNFIDDLLFMPLDISTLLSINEGDAQPIDFLKDLAVNADEQIEAENIEALKSAIQESMGLINSESLQGKMLARLMEVIDIMESSDLSHLRGFFKALVDGESFSFDNASTPPTTSAPSSTTSTPTPSPAPIEEEEAQPLLDPEEEVHAPMTRAEEDEEDETPLNVTPELIETAKSILRQQLEQLELLDDPVSMQRIGVISNKAFRVINETLHLDEEDFTHDTLLAMINEILEGDDGEIAPAAPTTPTKVEPVAVKPQAATPAKESKVPAKAESAKKEKDVVGKTVKIEQSLIDHLMGVVGELLVAKNSLPYLADSAISQSGEATRRAVMEKYAFINRLTNQLQDLIISMRMLPISYVFDRYPKLVRDISKNLGKKVKLVQEGKETKLDKNMIEMLADPLIHIVRNSLDHGIEMPEVREEKRKSAQGTLTMRAFAQSDRVIIEVVDDGGGIDVERVASKVLEKGLMGLEQIEALSENEKAELVMLPGLSTAEQISEYSGRGVGMDVVRKSVESFKGEISISTQRNVGTTITLSIPVSLAVTTLLHVSFNNLHYGIPMESVNETVKVTADEITYLNNEPFIYLRGQVIPILYLNELLNLQELEGRELPLVVLNIKGNQIALVVNDLLGQLDVVQKPLEGILSEHPLLAGTALLGNGQIIMVVDPIALWEYTEGKKSTPKVEA